MSSRRRMQSYRNNFNDNFDYLNSIMFSTLLYNKYVSFEFYIDCKKKRFKLKLIKSMFVHLS